ncbi:MAG TPA: hypothetical protein VIX59_21305 [Candidatus Binataceae bacterium]
MKSDRLTALLLVLIAVALWINLFILLGIRSEVSSLQSDVTTIQSALKASSEGDSD